MRIKTSDFFKSAVLPRDYPEEDLPEVAFAGKSNVGKSSLLNTILNRKRLAKTSSTPGRTQLINYFTINNSIFFVDLPGYGYAKVSKQKKKGWGSMMENYFRNSRNLRCVVLILDIRRLIVEDDFTLIKFLRSLDIPVIYALTKTDKVSNNVIFKQKNILKKSLGDYYVEDKFVLFSSLTKRGKDEMLDKISGYLDDSNGQST
jgi:GTP-binding protein